MKRQRIIGFGLCLAMIVGVLAICEDTASAGVSFRLSLGSGRFGGRCRPYRHHRPHYRRSYYHRRHMPYRYYYPSSYYTSYSYYGPYSRRVSYYDYPTTTYYDYPVTSYGGACRGGVVVRHIVVR